MQICSILQLYKCVKCCNLAFLKQHRVQRLLMTGCVRSKFQETHADKSTSKFVGDKFKLKGAQHISASHDNEEDKNLLYSESCVRFVDQNLCNSMEPNTGINEEYLTTSNCKSSGLSPNKVINFTQLADIEQTCDQNLEMLPCVGLSNSNKAFVEFNSNRLLQLGELVIFRLHRTKKNDSDYLLRLVNNREFSFAQNTVVSSESIIGRSLDAEHIHLHGHRISVRRPTLVEYLSLLQRNTAAATPKVLYSMFLNLGVTKGQKVLEAGTGSGIATMILSSLVGETGHVTTLDRSKKNHVKARKNFCSWAESCNLSSEFIWPSNVDFIFGDLSKYNVQKKFDLVFLDMCDLGTGLEVASCLLKEGGILAFYSPSISKLVDIDEAVREASLPLILEGVLEETDSRWHLVSSQFEADDCNVDGAAVKSLSVGWPLKNETSTAFLAKFRKVAILQEAERKDVESGENALSDNDQTRKVAFSDQALSGMNASSQDVEFDSTTHVQSVENASNLNSDTFTADEFAVLRFTEAKKKGKLRESLIQLKNGTGYYNDFGLLNVDDVVGRPVGTVMQTSTGFEFYCTRPSFTDRFEFSQENLLKTWTKHVALLIRLIDIQRGSSVVVMDDSRCMQVAVTAMLLETVHPAGQVVICHQEGSEWTNSFQEQIKCYNDIKEYLGEELRYLLPPFESIKHITASETCSVLYDGAYIRSKKPESHLPFAARFLRKHGLLGILCKSITGVNDVLQNICDLPLEVVDVHEHVDRPWVVQPIGITRKSGMSQRPNLEKPYICRPKQKMDQKVGYIIILRKM